MAPSPQNLVATGWVQILLDANEAKAQMATVKTEMIAGIKDIENETGALEMLNDMGAATSRIQSTLSNLLLPLGLFNSLSSALNLLNRFSQDSDDAKKKLQDMGATLAEEVERLELLKLERESPSQADFERVLALNREEFHTLEKMDGIVRKRRFTENEIRQLVIDRRNLLVETIAIEGEERRQQGIRAKEREKEQADRVAKNAKDKADREAESDRKEAERETKKIAREAAQHQKRLDQIEAQSKARLRSLQEIEAKEAEIGRQFNSQISINVEQMVELLQQIQADLPRNVG